MPSPFLLLSAASWPSGFGPMTCLASAALGVLLLILLFRWLIVRSRHRP